MNQYQRLKFYIACLFKDLKWKLCADKQIEEFEQSLVPEESVSGAEVKLIEDIIFMDEEEQKEQKPALEPRRTMLFISGRRTVSYTHLDVYKRQPLYLTLKKLRTGVFSI